MKKKIASSKKNNQPITLQDLKDALNPFHAQFKNLETRFDGLETRFDGLNQIVVQQGLDIKTLDTSIKGLQRHVLNIQIDVEDLKIDVADLKENVASKDDVKLIIDMQDEVAGMIKNRDQMDTLHAGSLNRHGDEIRNHEKRIHTLEKIISQK